MLTGCQQVQDRIDRCHTRSKRQPELTAFQGCQAGFESRTGWVAGAGIVIATMLAHSILYKGGGLVNGGHDCSRGRVRVLPGVDAGCFKLHRYFHIAHNHIP